MVLTVDNDVKAPLDSQLLIEHLADGLYLFASVCVCLRVVQEINDFILFLHLVDCVYQIAEVRSHMHKFVISALVRSVEQLIHEQILAVINHYRFCLCFADHACDPCVLCGVYGCGVICLAVCRVCRHFEYLYLRPERQPALFHRNHANLICFEVLETICLARTASAYNQYWCCHYFTSVT